MSHEIVQIIEDDPAQARLLDQILRQASFRTNVAYDGPSGIQDVWRIKPSVIMLDDNLPGMSGQEVCQRIRRDPATRHIPVILLSGFLSEQRRISGLDGGADDYISKPYGGGELVARVKAVLRRYQQGGTEQDQESDEELVLEGTLFVAQYRGKHLTLTPREWKLLRRLTTSSGKVVLREELSTLLWGDDGLLHECELDRCVEQLNRKLKDEGAPEEVRPVAGGGLRIISPAPSLTEP